MDTARSTGYGRPRPPNQAQNLAPLNAPKVVAALWFRRDDCFAVPENNDAFR